MNRKKRKHNPLELSLWVLFIIGVTLVVVALDWSTLIIVVAFIIAMAIYLARHL